MIISADKHVNFHVSGSMAAEEQILVELRANIGCILRYSVSSSYGDVTIMIHQGVTETE